MDINEIISSLSDDDINRLKNVAGSIFGSSDEKSVVPGDNNDIMRTIGSLNKMINTDDDRTALLKALKPLLSKPKQQKADEAIKILRLIQLVPMLRDSGFFKGLL